MAAVTLLALSVDPQRGAYHVITLRNVILWPTVAEKQVNFPQSRHPRPTKSIGILNVNALIQKYIIGVKLAWHGVRP
jgi:hypothetical protein